MMKNIFDAQVADEVIQRINRLKPIDRPQWGKMSVDQMLAHCNVSYAFMYEPEKFKKPGVFRKFLMKTFIKQFVVSEKPYPKNSRTAPAFIITDQRDFEKEKNKLIENIQRTQQLGFEYFDGRDSFSFGKMTGNEWNNMFYKHLEHHLTQFSV